MGNGYDFTLDDNDNENGFDFTTDDTELIAQEEAREAELWESLDESAIINEIQGLASRLSAAGKELAMTVDYNNYEKVAELIKALYMKDFSAEGWINKFYTTNSDTFKNTTGANWMIWFNNLSDEKQKQFRTVQEYYRDAGDLRNLCDCVDELLRGLPLKDGFQIGRMKENFHLLGITEKTYEMLEFDAKAISDQINQDWAAMERNAERSMMYYDANKDKLPPEKLAFYYAQERLKDYLDNMKRNEVNAVLIHRGNGQFAVDPKTYSLASVLDFYTYKISEFPNLHDSMQNVVDRAEKILETEVPEAEKALRTQICKRLVVAIKTVIQIVADFAEYAREVYDSFKSDSNIAPYCFMKKLSAYGSIKPKYGYSPESPDPWNNGTRFVDIYDLGAKAITAHCKDFVYNHGQKI